MTFLALGICYFIIGLLAGIAEWIVDSEPWKAIIMVGIWFPWAIVVLFVKLIKWADKS